MYTTCAFETAWSTKQSPWCVAFDDESIKVRIKKSIIYYRKLKDYLNRP